MIRNVVMGRLREAADAERAAADLAQLERALIGIAGLALPGQLSMEVGRDLALRAGGWDFAITNTWVDADSYRAYDTDEEHNAYRALVVEVSADVARVQIEV